jgi:hypothetical protein
MFFIFLFLPNTLKKKKIGLNCKNYGNDSDIKPLYIKNIKVYIILLAIKKSLVL